MKDTILFTPAAVLSLLMQITELQDKNIDFVESLNGKLQLIIGDSTYDIDIDVGTTVRVNEDTIDDVEDVNQQTYEDLVYEQGLTLNPEYVSSGLIMEAIKSILVGGAVRLANKVLDKDRR